MYDRFKTKKEIVEFFDEAVDEEDEKAIEAELRRPISKEIDVQSFITSEIKPLRDYFAGCAKTEERNGKIYQAYKDGYSQHRIAKELGISQPAVAKIIKRLSVII